MVAPLKQPTEAEYAESLGEARYHVLTEMLRACVPLRMAELQDQPVEDLRDWLDRTAPHDPDGLRSASMMQYADELMYGPPSPRRSEARRRLVDGLAALALCAPGGVDMLGMHWCRNHAHCLDPKAVAW